MKPAELVFGYQEKDATGEAWAKKLAEDGCPPFLLVIVQDQRVSVGSTLEGPVLLQIMDQLHERYVGLMGRVKKHEVNARKS